MFQSRNGSNGARDTDEESGYVPSIPEVGKKTEEMVRHLKPSYERAPSLAAAASPGQARRHGDGVLIIGAGVEVRGTIASCDELIVEGRVESTIECRSLSIAETGTVKGEAAVQELDVQGMFEGKADVAGCLTVRSTGRISGAIHYGELEVQRGGVVSGELGGVADPMETPARKPQQKEDGTPTPVAAE